MSSFGRYCEVTRSEREPVGKRYKSLRYAAERYAWLTRTSFESVFEDLERRCGLRVGSPNSSAILVAAAKELDEARRAFLAQQMTAIAQRKIEKRCGRRSPRIEWAAVLSTAVTLGRPLRMAAAARVPPESIQAIARGATPPEYEIGALVEVILNSRNKTPRQGRIERRGWHFKLGRWLYHLHQGSRSISKRYFAEDLKPGTRAD